MLNSLVTDIDKSEPKQDKQKELEPVLICPGLRTFDDDPKKHTLFFRRVISLLDNSKEDKELDSFEEFEDFKGFKRIKGFKGFENKKFFGKPKASKNSYSSSRSLSSRTPAFF